MSKTGKTMVPGTVERSQAALKAKCLVCGREDCDYRCNPIVSEGWDAMQAMLDQYRAKQRALTANEPGGKA